MRSAQRRRMRAPTAARDAAADFADHRDLFHFRPANARGAAAIACAAAGPDFSMQTTHAISLIGAPTDVGAGDRFRHVFGGPLDETILVLDPVVRKIGVECDPGPDNHRSSS